MFQYGGLCKNSKKKKIIIQRKKKEKKEEDKKGSHQNFVKWNGRKEYYFEEEEEVKKKIVEWKFQKELTFRQILKTLLIFTFTHFYFIPFAFTLHYVLIKSLFDLEDCVVQILIWLKKKVWYKFFLASFHETICSFLIKHFLCDLYVRCLILLTLFRSHILLRVLHPISEWFHLLSDNTGKNWVEAYFQIDIRVKFILKLRVCLGWLPLFTHIEFWWHEKFL